MTTPEPPEFPSLAWRAQYVRVEKYRDVERIAYEWCRRLDLPLMSPPRAPEAIDTLGREVERLRRRGA